MIGITEPVDTRIGQRLYPAGTTAEMLLATAARTGERVEAAVAAGRPDLAARHAPRARPPRFSTRRFRAPGDAAQGRSAVDAPRARRPAAGARAHRRRP